MLANKQPAILPIIVFALFVITSCAPFPRGPEIEPLPSPSAYVEKGMTYFQNKDFERASAYLKRLWSLMSLISLPTRTSRYRMPT